MQERYGRLDVLVNNAGIAVVADIEHTTTEIWRRTLAVHLDGTFFGCRAALALMAAGGGGSQARSHAPRRCRRPGGPGVAPPRAPVRVLA